jgi:hypothetical protein
MTGIDVDFCKEFEEKVFDVCFLTGGSGGQSFWPKNDKIIIIK